MSHRQPLREDGRQLLLGVGAPKVAVRDLQVERGHYFFDLVSVPAVDDGLVEGPDVVEDQLNEKRLLGFGLRA